MQLMLMVQMFNGDIPDTYHEIIWKQFCQNDSFQQAVSWAEKPDRYI